MRRSGVTYAILASSLLGLTPIMAMAQTTAVEWRQSCAECRVVARPLVRISSEHEESGPLHAIWTMTRDAAGRFWASFAGDDVPHVYTQSGDPIRSIGRIGDGPGEYRAVHGIVALSDSMLVFDPVLGRMTVVDDEFRATRVLSFAGHVFNGVALAWPRVAVNAHLPVGPATGHPFHIINIETGRVERSFGGTGLRSGGDMASSLGWIVADSSGNLWTALRTRFLIQQWNQEGTLLRTFEGLARWFPEGARGFQGSADRPPDGLVNALTVSNGALVIAVQLPASTWRSAWPSGRTSAAGHPASDRGPNRALLYDSYLAALNPADGTVLALAPVKYEAMSNTQVNSSILAMENLASMFPALIVVGVSAHTATR